MSKYLIRASYTAEGVQGLLKDGGSKRVKAVKAALEPLGAKVESFYYAIGEDDVYVTIDAPDLETVTAVSLATNASGAVKVSTTVLMTPEQVDAAVKKSVPFIPPGK
jgi:uncharacterized protein with GYD domain